MSNLNRHSVKGMLVVCLIVVFTCITDADEKQVNVTGTSNFKKPATQRDYWPTKEWKVKKPEDVGMNSQALKKMRLYEFSRLNPESERKGKGPNSVI